jgi:hypothetical protein
MRRLLLWIAAAAIVAMMGTNGYTQQPPGTYGLYESPGSHKQLSDRMWSQNDLCGRESFKRFPDYTVEGAAQRDAYMRKCLHKYGLPPRTDLAQPQAKQ